MMKPSYGTSKKAIWANMLFAWAVLLLLSVGAVLGVDQAVSLATIAYPSMAALIAGTLGIHRHYGSKDFAASVEEQIAESQPE